MLSPVKMDTCGHFPWMPVSVGMLQGTWSTPLTQHIAETRQNAAWEFKTWMIKRLFFYLSVCLCCNSCAFRWLFYRGFLFSSGLGDLCSHAFWCNKGTQPINWLNKDRKLPPENSSQAPAPPSPTEAEEQARDQKWPQRDVWELAKCGKDAEETRILPIFFSSSRVCKWRNWPRRKWDAEYNAQVHWWMGTGAMTTKPPRLHQSQVRNPTSRVVVVVRRGVSWSWGREGRVMDTIGETTTTWPTTCF